MGKVDRCVVRNQAYRRGEFGIRERHNERKNESYHNGDVVLDRAHLNVHFKACAGTYEQTFNRMVEDGSISLRGLRKDAKVFDEMVFDVNTGYFEEHGGYEYAKEFFTEAYKLAVKEAGGEEYILSAVMHADERNKALSEQYGRDVFHYHLHVVYVPVVEKEVRYTKRCKHEPAGAADEYEDDYSEYEDSDRDEHQNDADLDVAYDDYDYDYDEAAGDDAPPWDVDAPEDEAPSDEDGEADT